MTDDRALSWQCLFPNDTSYNTRGGPDWFRDLVQGRSRGQGAHRVLVTSEDGDRVSTLGDADGVVGVNARGLSPAALSGAGFAYVRRFAVVPGLRDARWYIPLDTPAIAAGSFGLYAPYRLPARLKRSAVALAARTRLPFWYRDEIVIAQRIRPPLEEAVRERIPGVTTRLALSSGTPGPSRKPTAAALDHRGRLMAIAKVAISARSEELMRREAQALTRLTRDIPGRAPELLFERVVDGAYVTMQSVLGGTPAPPVLTRAHERFLGSLAGCGAGPASSSPLVRALRDRHGALRDPGFTLAPLDDVMPVLDVLMQPPTFVHGDFAPWNLRQHGREIAAFDWEYAESDGLPVIDAFHHVLHAGFLLSDWTGERASERVMRFAFSASTQHSPEQMRALAMVHLLDVLLRRREEGYGADDRLYAGYREVCARVHAARREGVVA